MPKNNSRNFTQLLPMLRHVDKLKIIYTEKNSLSNSTQLSIEVGTYGQVRNNVVLF